jgi:hypothetical protein
VDRSAQRAIQEMRHAELKELVSRTVADTHVEINVLAADYPGQNVANGDPVTTISWVFDGADLQGQPVFETLRNYLRHVSGLVEEAERTLVSLATSARSPCRVPTTRSSLPGARQRGPLRSLVLGGPVRRGDRGLVDQTSIPTNA